MNKVLLVEADLEVLKGNFDIAESKYRQSIVFAEHEGFLPEQALACEKLARMLLVHNSSGNYAKAESYLIQARSLYKTYGAVILVERITNQLESLNGSAEQVLARRKVKRVVKKPSSYGCLVPQLSERDFQLGLC